MNIVLCPYCNRKARLITGKQLYRSIKRIKHYRFWRCDSCDAHAKCSRDGKPIGSLANAELRQLRRKAHDLMEWIVASGTMDESELHKMLCQSVGRKSKRVMLVHYSKDDCQAIVDLLEPIQHDLRPEGGTQNLP